MTYETLKKYKELYTRSNNEEQLAKVLKNLALYEKAETSSKKKKE